VVHNAVLFTAGQVLEQTAIVIQDGRITELGGEELAEIPARRTIDAAGGLVTPGFVDAHVHAAFGGVEMNRCDLSACTNAEEVFATIRRYADANPGLDWIVGGATLWPTSMAVLQRLRS